MSCFSSTVEEYMKSNVELLSTVVLVVVDRRCDLASGLYMNKLYQFC